MPSLFSLLILIFGLNTPAQAQNSELEMRVAKWIGEVTKDIPEVNGPMGPTRQRVFTGRLVDTTKPYACKLFVSDHSLDYIALGTPDRTNKDDDSNYIGTFPAESVLKWADEKAIVFDFNYSPPEVVIEQGGLVTEHLAHHQLTLFLKDGLPVRAIGVSTLYPAIDCLFE